MTITVDDASAGESWSAGGAGTLVTAPIGAPHTVANADGHAPASFPCTLTPQRCIGYLEEPASLRAGSDGRLDPVEILAVRSRYGTEPYPPAATAAPDDGS